MNSVKCVAVGDPTVGKTSLLITFAANEFPVEYKPTVFDNYFVTLVQDSHPITLSLWDTAGQEAYDRLRPLSYPDADVFLLCYSVAARSTMTNLKVKWLPEVLHYQPDACMVIVGTKIDLRDNPEEIEDGSTPVTQEEGMQFTKDLQCESYSECSALTQRGVRELFESAVAVVLKKRNVDKKAVKAQRKKPWWQCNVLM